MILHIYPKHTRMDRLHQIEESYGPRRPGPTVTPGHPFLATTYR